MYISPSVYLSIYLVIQCASKPLECSSAQSTEIHFFHSQKAYTIMLGDGDMRLGPVILIFI